MVSRVSDVDYVWSDLPNHQLKTLTQRHLYQARGVLYLPNEARFSALLAIPEGANIGQEPARRLWRAWARHRCFTGRA